MLKKEITFIYMDASEKNQFQPIAEEAMKRGYKVKMTENTLEKCEIGFYCQHVNFPQFSKFSFIMLHDLVQGYSRWPDLWYEEPWDKYDVGILPSNQWENNWNQCSQWSYTRPRKGMYKIGWPKADVMVKLKSRVSKEEWYKEHGLDINKPTILYAPAWENDHKQDDFVRAMQKLDVNILIKQAMWAPQYPKIIKNVKEMYYLHKDIPGVYILPPPTNIFEAIAVSDILVSEESSTMCEATMMGIPAISVSNWLIPDVTPSRYPKCDYNFVTMTKRETLTECVSEMLQNYSKYKKQTQEFADKTFSNIGNTATMIMDIVDDCVNGVNIRYQPLKPRPAQEIPFVKDLKRKIFLWRQEVSGNYRKRYTMIYIPWRIVKFIVKRK